VDHELQTNLSPPSEGSRLLYQGDATTGKGRIRALFRFAAAVAPVVAALGCREPKAVRQSTGDLSVTMFTTGAGIPPEYFLDIEGPGGIRSERIGSNATVTFSGISPGEYTLAIAQLNANCTVSGGNLRTATVPAGGDGRTTFSVSCTATGDLMVTTSTTGTGIPTDYALDILAPDGSTFFSWRIGANETLTFLGSAPGDYTLTLGVLPNCTLSEANPRTVTVPAGDTGSTTFSVSCTATGA
jgi:hypothetical protein